MAEAFRQEQVWDEYQEVVEQMGEFLASATGGGSSETYDQLVGFEEDLKNDMADIGTGCTLRIPPPELGEGQAGGQGEGSTPSLRRET